MLNQIRNDAMGKLLLRLTVAGLMLFHGVAKIMHPGSLEFIGTSLSSAGMPSALAYGVYIGRSYCTPDDSCWFSRPYWRAGCRYQHAIRYHSRTYG